MRSASESQAAGPTARGEVYKLRLQNRIRAVKHLLPAVPGCQQLPSASPSLVGWPAEDGERKTAAASTVICLGSFSGFTCVLPMDSHYLACPDLAWLALWPSWCYTRGPPSLLCQANSRAQQVPGRLGEQAGLTDHQTPPIPKSTIWGCR